MTLYPAFRCTLTVRIFLAMYWLVPCISPLPKSEASLSLIHILDLVNKNANLIRERMQAA